MKFDLLRYFTIASTVSFTLVAAALVLFERQQSDDFKQAQTSAAQFFETSQSDFAKRQDDSARRDLLAIHENGNVNLTRLFANSLWEKDFAPFVAIASQIPVDHCRAIEDLKDEKTGKKTSPPEKKACYAEVGKRIMALPMFRQLDAKVFDSMKKSSVFKIKVFDLRGITVYSSEHAQVGEDKAGNAGWQRAVAGTPASELTHRDKFSAFEGVVENRDVISSYLPVLRPGTSQIVGVFEVYSDVTQFLGQIKKTSDANKKASSDALRALHAADEVRLAEADRSSWIAIAVVTGLLVALFGTLFVVVRRAQRLLAAQEAEREQAQQQLAQAEKMASLGQMVAGVAHQLNTPLAFSQGNVQMVREALDQVDWPLRAGKLMAGIIGQAESDRVVLDIAKARKSADRPAAVDVDLGMLQQMLDDVLAGIAQMSELVVNLRDFTRLDRAKVADVDINQSLRTVIYIAKSVIPHDIRVEQEFGALPPVECNPSQLNQVFLNLINNAAQAIGERPGTIRVHTSHAAGQVCIDISDDGGGIPPDVLPHIFDLYFTTKPAGEGTGLGLPIARDIVRQHGGDITVSTELGKGSTFTVTLPLTSGAGPV